MDDRASAKEPCGNDARIVQDKELIAAEEIGKFGKKVVSVAAD
jgi:hypothetical protein